MDSYRKKAVIILGCHRSGTEMVSDCLHAGGVLMGDMALLGNKTEFTLPQLARWVVNESGEGTQNPLLDVLVNVSGCSRPLRELLPCTENSHPLFSEKPREDRRFTFINHSILNAAGYSWDEPKEADSKQKGVGDVGKALIDEYSTCKPFWGLKDPRTLFTYNFWERLFKNTDHELKLVFIYRNPMSVAKGVCFQGGKNQLPNWPIPRGIELWKTYNKQALRLMDKTQDKIVLKYEAFFDGDNEVEMLDNFLELDGKLNNPFNSSKCHYPSTEIPPDCQNIYNQLEEKRMEINFSLTGV